MSISSSVILERSDGRLLERALLWHLGELMEVMPGGGSLDAKRRTLGALVLDLTGIASALTCVGGCEAPDGECRVPTDSLREASGWTLDYASRCLSRMREAREDGGREDVAAYWEAESSHAFALGERLEAMA